MGSYILTLAMEEKLGREEEDKHFFLWMNASFYIVLNRYHVA
jgi:hypothetical protein